MVIDVEKIRSVCKSKGTSLTKVEKALGFSNGAIGKWAKSQGGPSYDRILKVAQALGVNVEDLTAGQKEEPTPVSESGLEPERLELINEIREMDIERVKAFLIAIGKSGK